MNKAFNYIAVLCILFLTEPVLAGAVETDKLPDKAVITILTSQPEGIRPNPLTVQRGSTIVWYNHDAEPVKIIFDTEIDLACKVPVNFYADLLGNYESTKIAQGATASICIIKPGEYKYTVKRLVTGKDEKPYEMLVPGKIIVK